MSCKVLNKFFDVAEYLKETDKVPRDYGTGHLLYHSEVNFLEIIYKYPDANANEIAKLLEITKGAVTQTGNKLEEKGLAEKYSKVGNRKEKYFRLTEAGILARKGHVQHHYDANRKICDYIQTLDKHSSEIIMEFLETLMDLPVSEFECSASCLLQDEILEIQ